MAVTQATTLHTKPLIKRNKRDRQFSAFKKTTKAFKSLPRHLMVKILIISTIVIASLIGFAVFVIQL